MLVLAGFGGAVVAPELVPAGAGDEDAALYEGTVRFPESTPAVPVGLDEVVPVAVWSALRFWTGAGSRRLAPGGVFAPAGAPAPARDPFTCIEVGRGGALGEAWGKNTCSIPPATSLKAEPIPCPIVRRITGTCWKSTAVTAASPAKSTAPAKRRSVRAARGPDRDPRARPTGVAPVASATANARPTAPPRPARRGVGSPIGRRSRPTAG